ncbi:MAG: ABC transporter ATP-binding protein [Gammaproteobacteria bacterium]
MSSLLQVQDLSIDFRDVRAPGGWQRTVDQVSFAVQPGEIVGIVGESGSGKTVTCRSLIQLLPPRLARVSGQVQFGGQNLLELDPPALGQIRGEQIAMIFQTPSSHLDPLMRVGEQIAEALIVHRNMSRNEARQAAIELLDHVGISEPARNVSAYPHQFSGGMRQRVMIAAALACRPALLLADEPTTALDVTVQAKVLDLLRRLRDEDGLSIILVSHDLGVIAGLCDRVIVMYQGRIVETAPTRELLRHPQQAYTRKLIHSQPEMTTPGQPFPGIDPGINPDLDPDIHNKTAERIDSARSNPAVASASIESGGQDLLVVNDLQVRFRQPSSLLSTLLRRAPRVTRAVDGVSLQIRRGDTLGIVGESGSGKSTLARTMVDLIQPDGGSIRFDGHDLSALSDAQRQTLRRQVQMVFQDPQSSLNPKLSIEATLSEALRVHQVCPVNDIPQRVQALMQRVGLDPALANRRPHQLSGGQCQRVGIARALSLNPQLIIADEATSALDVTIQAQILNLLMHLREQMQLTLIFISHDLSVVRHLCRTVAVMQSGRIVESGSVEQIFNAPQHPYTRQLIEAIPTLD